MEAEQQQNTPSDPSARVQGDGRPESDKWKRLYNDPGQRNCIHGSYYCQRCRWWYGRPYEEWLH